ncbi:hypothetical protein [Arenibacter certesii]|uniref:Uncharacterized protein n=1 Tax=Arenibacter certesii TaxID=228955 RepID=A0A918ITA3_9FLAO|nr:hypothetical protein [Arenibacter certesii]GGW26921.1 hypothetical protein GCM10007383_10280 [Arenibacter certesii]
MRKFNLILVAVMLLSIGSISANSRLDDKPAKSLSQQIKELLSNNALRVPLDAEMSGVVYFTVNSEKEMVVLSVLTNEEALESYVKGRLNYIKVECSDYEMGITYKIPVRIKG